MRKTILGSFAILPLLGGCALSAPAAFLGFVADAETGGVASSTVNSTICDYAFWNTSGDPCPTEPRINGFDQGEGFTSDKSSDSEPDSDE